MQAYSDSIPNALMLLQYRAKPSIYITQKYFVFPNYIPNINTDSFS